MTESHEECYTLEQARIELARRECIAHGHDWSIVMLGDGTPVVLACDRCGWRGSVTKL